MRVFGRLHCVREKTLDAENIQKHFFKIIFPLQLLVLPQAQLEQNIQNVESPLEVVLEKITIVLSCVIDYFEDPFKGVGQITLKFVEEPFVKFAPSDRHFTQDNPVDRNFERVEGNELALILNYDGHLLHQMQIEKRVRS